MHASRPCPHCRAPLPSEGACASCGGQWLPGAEVDTFAPGKLAALRRLAGKGPVARESCADCRGALKSIDVPGVQHEGDLFWGHESSRPSGTSVAEACPRCGGLWVDAENLARAGGVDSFVAHVRGVMLTAS